MGALFEIVKVYRLGTLILDVVFSETRFFPINIQWKGNTQGFILMWEWLEKYFESDL